MDNALVIKLGGSSAVSRDLVKWITVIERAGRPVVVVPGGGPFANTVRRYQPRIGFDDHAAHAMAILAMEQFGWALTSLGTRLVHADTPERMAAAFENGQIPVWMPLTMVLGDEEVKQDWSVTSDGLAGWLAGRIGARNLCLIKQIDLPPDSDIHALTAARIVDESFAQLIDPNTAVNVAGPSDLMLAGARLADGQVPGRPVPWRPILAGAAAE